LPSNFLLHQLLNALPDLVKDLLTNLLSLCRYLIRHNMGWHIQPQIHIDLKIWRHLPFPFIISFREKEMILKTLVTMNRKSQT